jgi:N-acetylneuraminic acid mutarotase
MKSILNRNIVFLLVILLSFLSLAFLNVKGQEENSWTTLAPMPTSRSGLGIASADDKIYAVGGVTSSGFTPSSPGSAVYAGLTSATVTGTNEQYNPQTDTWEPKEPMPTSRAVFAIATYHKKIYCIGGKTSEGYTTTNEVYNPETDTWTTKASMSTPRAFIQANVVNDKIYLIGGHGLSPDEFPLVNEVYDPETDTWTTKQSMPSRTIFGYASVVVDNKIHIIGGVSEDQQSVLN